MSDSAASILDDRALTKEEREAIADEPRRGVWIESHNGFVIGDGRPLTQHETDCTIVRELLRSAKWRDVFAHEENSLAIVEPWLHQIRLDAEAGHRERQKMAGFPRGNPEKRYVVPSQQRCGLHSDDLIRLLSFRVWGNRDRDLGKTLAVILGVARSGAGASAGEIVRSMHDFCRQADLAEAENMAETFAVLAPAIVEIDRFGARFYDWP